MVKKANLEKFIKLRGYDTVELKGETWRGIAEACRRTGLSEATIRRLLKEYPKPREPQVKQVWIPQEEYEQLDEAVSQLKMVSKQLENVQKYFERSLIVDFAKLRARQELLGITIESFRESLKRQVEAGEKEKSSMEELLNHALREFRHALDSLQGIIAGTSQR